MSAATVSTAGTATKRPKASRVRRLARRAGGGEALAGIIIMIALVAIAVLAPIIAPHDPEAINSSRILASPNMEHPFGSDALGRDVLSRVIYAFRVSLTVAIGSVTLAFLIAVPLGLISGFAGGWVDTIVMRPLDLLLALPALLMAITFIAIIGPGAQVALIAIALIYLPIVARVVRGSVLVTKGLPYVDGARSRGASEFTLLRRHILPNSMGPALIQGRVVCGRCGYRKHPMDSSSRCGVLLGTILQ